MGSGERSLSPSVSAKMESAVQGELDLKARVFAFPPSRRADRVRVVAGMIEGMSAPDASRYWKRTVKALGRQLAAVGIPADEIERQQRRFFAAVQQELVRRSYRDCGGTA